MDQAPESLRSPGRLPIATPMKMALTKDIRPMYGMSGRLVDPADKFLRRAPARTPAGDRRGCRLTSPIPMLTSAELLDSRFQFRLDVLVW